MVVGFRDLGASRVIIHVLGASRLIHVLGCILNLGRVLELIGYGRRILLLIIGRIVEMVSLLASLTRFGIKVSRAYLFGIGNCMALWPDISCKATQ